MDRIIFLLSLKPIIYGFIGIVISGISFPVAGVIIVRNGLIPMRYMLMHGVILGGIVSVCLGFPLLSVVVPLNVILVLCMMWVNKKGHSLSNSSTTMMVCTMGLASLFGHIFDVPAKDTLELLWGSPFALTLVDLSLLGVLAVLIVLYVIVFFRPISMIFFDNEIACSLGVNVQSHNVVMMLFTALIISVAMKLVGALLIDALVVLPVIGVSKNATSLKRLFIGSSVLGFCLSVTGYLISVVYNLPISGVLALLATVVFFVSSLYNFIKKRMK